jgi:peroxiredoxin
MRRSLGPLLACLAALASFAALEARVAGAAPRGVSPAVPAPIVPAPAFPWLGVSMDSGGASGVTVRHVVRSSPAHKAGMKTGDRIVRLDGGLMSRAPDVTRAVGLRAAGDVVEILISRGGREQTLRATLEARPSSDDVLRMDHVGAAAPTWVNVAPVAAAPTALAQLRGRVAIVDFWATWCGACRLAAPHLSALQARYGAQGLTVVGITTDDAEKAATFAQNVEARFPIVLDPDGDTTGAYGVSELPTLFLVDKRGVVRHVEVGFGPAGAAEVERLVKELLAEPAAP